MSAARPLAISALERVVDHPATRAELVELAGEDVVCGLEEAGLLGRRTCRCSLLWPEHWLTSFITAPGRRYLGAWHRRRLARWIAWIMRLGAFSLVVPRRLP